MMSHIFNSTKDFEVMLAAIGLQTIGGIRSVNKMINEADQNGVFENKMQKSRIKKYSRELSKYKIKKLPDCE